MRIKTPVYQLFSISNNYKILLLNKLYLLDLERVLPPELPLLPDDPPELPLDLFTDDLPVEDEL